MCHLVFKIVFVGAGSLFSSLIRLATPAHSVNNDKKLGCEEVPLTTTKWKKSFTTKSTWYWRLFWYYIKFNILLWLSLASYSCLCLFIVNIAKYYLLPLLMSPLSIISLTYKYIQVLIHINLIRVQKWLLKNRMVLAVKVNCVDW